MTHSFESGVLEQGNMGKHAGWCALRTRVGKHCFKGCHYEPVSFDRVNETSQQRLFPLVCFLCGDKLITMSP